MTIGGFIGWLFWNMVRQFMLIINGFLFIIPILNVWFAKDIKIDTKDKIYTENLWKSMQSEVIIKK